MKFEKFGNYVKVVAMISGRSLKIATFDESQNFQFIPLKSKTENSISNIKFFDQFSRFSSYQ